MERTCKKCGETNPIEEYLRKGYPYAFLDMYLKAYKLSGCTSAFTLYCIDCREIATDRIKRRKKAKEERSNNIRRMMGYLKDDERGHWKYQNEKALYRISNILKGGHNQMYYNKNIRDLVETQTLQIELINLIKDQENERCDNSQK